jgi:hypothetical protein
MIKKLRNKPYASKWEQEEEEEKIWQIIIWKEMMVSSFSVSQYLPEENGQIHNNRNQDSQQPAETQTGNLPNINLGHHKYE